MGSYFFWYPDNDERKIVQGNKAQAVFRASMEYDENFRYVVVRTFKYGKVVADFPEGIMQRLLECEKPTEKQDTIRAFDLPRAWVRRHVRSPLQAYRGLYSGGDAGHPWYGLVDLRPTTTRLERMKAVESRKPHKKLSNFQKNFLALKAKYAKDLL